MKKSVLLLTLLALAVFASCTKEDNSPIDITVQLTSDGTPLAIQDVTVSLTDGAATFEQKTDSKGSVAFTVPAGLYTASAAYKTSEDGVSIQYNGSNNQVSVVKAGETAFSLSLTKVETNQIIIKELYVGGCMDNAGAKQYITDKYIILYNNSDVEADASKLNIAIAGPLSASGANKYLVDGKLSFESEGWIPALYAYWEFQSDVKIAPYSQIVISITGAIDHTATYSNSVDLSAADYCFYDPESGFSNAASYPAPAAGIPSSHYMQTYVFGMGNAWPIHMSQPALYIFQPKDGASASSLAQNAEAYDHTLGTSGAFNAVKVPTNWVVDAVEAWDYANIDKSGARFPASVNTGYVGFTAKAGHSIYRNVDKEATEALAENAGKLVYNYAGGTADIEGTTDPSGIDAEASIKAGAHIIYKDTNSSTNDFHMRKVASIKK